VSAFPEVDEVLAALAAAMRDGGFRWYLFGAQAASLWGRPRFSGDVDVTIAISQSDLPEFIRVMQTSGFKLRFDDREFMERARVFPFLHEPTSYPIDVVLAGPGLEEEFLSRAVMVEGVPVISPEDLIITKVLAGRSKDIEDVRGVLRERADSLDLSRIRTLLGLLEEALTRGDLLSAFENELARVMEH